MDNLDATLEYIGRIDKANSPDELCAEFLSVISEFGLTARLIRSPLKKTSNSKKNYILLGKWPRICAENGFRQKSIPLDELPTSLRSIIGSVENVDVRLSAESRKPCIKKHVKPKRNSDQDALILPYPTLNGMLLIVSPPTIDISDEQLDQVILLSSYVLGHALRMIAKQKKRCNRKNLTARETECIKWAARGKSEWEISRILGISEHTSEKHLLNAKAKLGAANRAQAVAEAIRLGYIVY